MSQLWKFKILIISLLVFSSLMVACTSADWEAERHRNRGDNNVEAGNLEQAIKDYTKAIELGPDNPRFYSARAGAYVTFKFISCARAAGLGRYPASDGL